MHRKQMPISYMKNIINSMKKIFLIFLMTMCAIQVFATAQYPDILVYEGKEYELFTNPMEPFFEEHSDLRPESTCTALWRGYVAKFEIRDNQLVVSDILILELINYKEVFTSIYDKIFPEQKNVVVTWMTGILTLPCGELTNYVHMGYGSTYNAYKLLQIENGKLVQTRDFTEDEYIQYRHLQYEAFKKTKTYKDAVDEIRKSEYYDAQNEEMLDEFIRSFYSSVYYNIYIPFPKSLDEK